MSITIEGMLLASVPSLRKRALGRYGMAVRVGTADAQLTVDIPSPRPEGPVSFDRKAVKAGGNSADSRQGLHWRGFHDLYRYFAVWVDCRVAVVAKGTAVVSSPAPERPVRLERHAGKFSGCDCRDPRELPAPIGAAQLSIHFRAHRSGPGLS